MLGVPEPLQRELVLLSVMLVQPSFVPLDILIGRIEIRVLSPGRNAMRAECERATMRVCIEAQSPATKKSAYKWEFPSVTTRPKRGCASNPESPKNAPRVYRP
jgi:hypothetical protein